MLTSELLASDDASALLMRTESEIEKTWISTLSQWGSSKWRFDNQSHGYHKSSSAIRWEILLHDGSLLTDDKHAELLSWLRKLVWSLFSSPARGFAPLNPSTSGNISNGLARLVPWLVENGIRFPREFTSEVLNRYLEELPEILASLPSRTRKPREASQSEDEGDQEAEITVAVATTAISIVYYIWRQRKVLQKLGIEAMPGRPWPEFVSLHSIAVTISTRALGWIRPLPDEVAVPLLNRAFWFLGPPAEDIIHLNADLYATYASTDAEGCTEDAFRQRVVIRQNRVLREFVNSTLSNKDAPWHAQISFLSDPSGETESILRRFRQLALDLQAACCAVIQGLSGLRVSELCGLKSGSDPDTGLPTGVTMRLSPSGQNEEFVLLSETSKGQSSPREVPWLLGSRCVGNQELPVVVKAIQVVDRLLSPWRKLMGTDQLLLSATCANGTPKRLTSIAPASTDVVSRGYKHFLSRWVDLTKLPDESGRGVAQEDLARWRESQGSIITTHQLRKTYASYVLTVHPDLLPALKRQFHHVFMSITESGYWGSNATQIEPLHSVSRQMTAQMLYEAVQGKSKLGGKMGRRILDHIDQLRAQIPGGLAAITWGKVYRWVESNGLHVNHAPHGACMPLAASRMACWKRAGSRPIGNLLPNLQTRDAALCAGCRCFAMDARHLPFWRMRYISHESSWRMAQRDGVSERTNYRAVRTRADQALKILLDTGECHEALERDVLEEMCRYDEGK